MTVTCRNHHLWVNQPVQLPKAVLDILLPELMKRNLEFLVLNNNQLDDGGRYAIKFVGENWPNCKDINKVNSENKFNNAEATSYLSEAINVHPIFQLGDVNQ